MLSNTCCLYTL